MITGIGGGMLRDVLLGEITTVLREGLYAVPALLGAVVLVVAQEAGSTSPVLPVLGAVVCVVVRLIGLRSGVALPTACSKWKAISCSTREQGSSYRGQQPHPIVSVVACAVLSAELPTYTVYCPGLIVKPRVQ
jgi:hypothetical protein